MTVLQAQSLEKKENQHENRPKAPYSNFLESTQRNRLYLDISSKPMSIPQLLKDPDIPIFWSLPRGYSEPCGCLAPFQIFPGVDDEAPGKGQGRDVCFENWAEGVVVGGRGGGRQV